MTYALHRVTQKSYSDGTTPTVRYGYDAIAPSGCTPPALTINNGVGRRTSMCDAAGAEAWSYDAIGRAQTDRRTTNSITKDTLYGYNLDGSIATLTYPGGRMITYQPGGAGRPLWAKDLASGISYVTGTCGPTSAGVCYAPQGSAASLQNGASIVSTLYYNSRLQPCRISVKSSGTAPTQCSDTTNIGNVLDFSYNFSVGTADNGNVVSIANNRDTNRMQNFTYDSMNRIATAYTSGNLWGETFQIDQWDNLNKILPYSSKPQPENLNQMAGNNNRFTGMSYDAAGNLLNDGASTYFYDAENQIKTGAGVTYQRPNDFVDLLYRDFSVNLTTVPVGIGQVQWVVFDVGVEVECLRVLEIGVGNGSWLR